MYFFHRIVSSVTRGSPAAAFRFGQFLFFTQQPFRFAGKVSNLVGTVRVTSLMLRLSVRSLRLIELQSGFQTLLLFFIM